MEAKRMRLNENSRESANKYEAVELKVWQDLQLSKCYDDNYINRLLESTRSFLVASEELTVENEAISTAINTFGLKKNQFDTFEDSTTSEDSNLPSTSSQSNSRQHSSSSRSSQASLESEAISSAISSYGLHKNPLLD